MALNSSGPGHRAPKRGAGIRAFANELSLLALYLAVASTCSVAESQLRPTLLLLAKRRVPTPNWGGVDEVENRASTDARGMKATTHFLLPLGFYTEEETAEASKEEKRRRDRDAKRTEEKKS